VATTMATAGDLGRDPTAASAAPTGLDGSVQRAVGDHAGASHTVSWTPSTPWTDLTLTDPVCALTLPPPRAGSAAQLQLILRQDAIGRRKVRWPANVNSAGSIPALTTARNGLDLFTLYSDDGATWSLDGTPGGPAGSIDPLALADPVVVVEARAQPLHAGDVIAATGGQVDRVLDRGPLGHDLLPSGTASVTFDNQPAPGSPWYRVLQPAETGFPRLTVGAGGVLGVDALRPVDDYLLFYLVWLQAGQPGPLDFNYLTLTTDSDTMLWTSGIAHGYWRDRKGDHSYTTSPGNLPNYSLVPMLGVISVGRHSPDGPHALYHRLNGQVQHFASRPIAPTGLTGIQLGAPPTTTMMPTAMDVLAVGVVTPCPPLADIRRVEQWLSGLGGTTVVSM
jgi:hypothetical protein